MSDTTPGAREDPLRELALRLSTFPGDPRNEDLQLLVGQLPDNLAIPVPMPENSRVLGTLIRGPESIDVILDSALSPAAVMSFYKESLAASGWNELDEMRPAMHDGGFVHTGFRAFENHATYCKGPDGQAFTVTAYERKQGLISERGANGRQRAVKQDQGLTFPVHFIIHVEAVHLSIAPFAHGHAGFAFRVGISSSKRERGVPSEKELSL